MPVFLGKTGADGVRFSLHLQENGSSAVLALLAALTWGGGDFSGGMGVKAAGGSTRGALRVVMAGHAMSLAVLLVVFRATHGHGAGGGPMLWGLGAGVAGSLALTAFYVALARGAMGTSAAVSGLLAAAIPAAVSMGMEGAPSALRLAGFGFAAAAIWLIAAGPGSELDPKVPGSRGTFGLAVFGGVGFGIYFVALRFANPLGVLEPMWLARAASVSTCAVLLPVLGRERATGTSGPWLSRRAWLWAVGVAVLDTGGNLLFLAATRSGRLDVAAVLASLYPASTILLAAALLQEHPSRKQMVGMAVAVAAVVMITV